MNPAVLILIVLVAGEAAAGLMFGALAHRAGTRSATRKAQVDWFRRGWFEATGTWPEHPPRRPGVIEP